MTDRPYVSVTELVAILADHGITRGRTAVSQYCKNGRIPHFTLGVGGKRSSSYCIPKEYVDDIVASFDRDKKNAAEALRRLADKLDPSEAA